MKTNTSSPLIGSLPEETKKSSSHIGSFSDEPAYTTAGPAESARADGRISVGVNAAGEQAKQNKKVNWAFRKIVPSIYPSQAKAFEDLPAIKPGRPTTEAASIAMKEHLPPSRAPSATSQAPTRASTISINSTSNTPLGIFTTTKEADLAASIFGKIEVKSLQPAATAAETEQLVRGMKAVLKEDRDDKRNATAGPSGVRDAELGSAKKSD